MGVSWGCESEDGEYNLVGCSYISDGCGSEEISVISCGNLYTGNEENSDISDMFIINCGSYESDFYDGTTGCYSGCAIGKGDDCGDCLGIYGENDEYDAEETTIGCLDGCFTCDDTQGMWDYVFSIIYDMLGIGGY